jgi:succinate dehydrogenase / fumarate reductase, flavoprotein subunit
MGSASEPSRSDWPSPEISLATQLSRRASSCLNQALEHAGRVADFLGFAELMCLDALERNESCGAHFRLESQTKEGEALRDDEHCCHVAAWEHTDARPNLIKEPLGFEYVKLSQRSYK